MLAAVSRYAAGPLARRLGLDARAVAAEPATRGARSLVYFLDVGGERRAVLRAVRRLPDAAKLAYNHSRLRASGLPVARVLTASASPLTRLRWGFYPVVEEYIDGRHVAPRKASETAVRAVARALARFHGVERRRWGWPWFPRWGSYRKHYLARIARRARCVDEGLETGRSEELMAWFQARAREAPLEPPYALLHGRVHGTNFVVTPEGQAVALDLLECRFGSFAADVNWALPRICGDDAQRGAWFTETYFAHRPQAYREAFARSRPFFQAAYRLGRAAIYTRRARRARGRRAEKLERLRIHLAALADLTGIDMTADQR